MLCFGRGKPVGTYPLNLTPPSPAVVPLQTSHLIELVQAVSRIPESQRRTQGPERGSDLSEVTQQVSAAMGSEPRPLNFPSWAPGTSGGMP